MMRQPKDQTQTILRDQSFDVLPHGVIAKARFAPEAYAPDLFDRLSVSCPAQIARASTKRKIDFLAGRLIAREALTHAGAPVSDLPIGPDRAPVWPTGISGSISHAQQNCVALVADDTHLCGIDCEGLLSGHALEAVRAQCLSAGEQDWITQQSRYSDAVTTSLVFSAKETIFKALAPVVQQFFGFECAEVQGWSDDRTLAFKLTKDLHQTAAAGLVLHAQYDVTDTTVLTWIVMPQEGNLTSHAQMSRSHERSQQIK